MREEDPSGAPGGEERAYAIAKIAGINLWQAYRRSTGPTAAQPCPQPWTGPTYNFDLTARHVLPALIRKFHDAKAEGARRFTIWARARRGGSSCVVYYLLRRLPAT